MINLTYGGFETAYRHFLEFPLQDTNFKPPLSESRGMRFQRDQSYLKIIEYLNFRHFRHFKLLYTLNEETKL